MIEFRLPEIGEGVVEGEIVRWLKQPGDTVDANEALVEVMTDKATIEVPAPASAVLQEIRAEVGQICAIEDVIAILTPIHHKNQLQPDRSTTSTSPEANARKQEQTIPATPAARAFAREAGIVLQDVPLGDHGRITKQDVLHFHQQPQAPVSATKNTLSTESANVFAKQNHAKQTAAAPSAMPDSLEQREYIPFRGLRRRIAESMTKSFTQAVHYTYVEQINVTRLVQLREEAKVAAAEQGISLNYLPFIVKAVIHGLKRFPLINAELEQENNQIIIKKYYHIGIATATDNGLVVPTLRHADRLSILATAREIARLSEAARNGTATREELTGSTFTVTSLGTIGGVLATPILNYPEVGILGVHAIRKTPIVDANDQIVVGHLMNLSISLDHRIVDGFVGASFLQEVRRYLEDPNLLLLAGI